VERGIERGLMSMISRRASVLLGHPQRLLRGDRQAARGASHLGASHEGALRREEPAFAGDALPLADGRRHAHGAAAHEQHRARVAYQALAAVLGGTQSLHTNSMDETLALPTEEAVQVALRTQQVLAYETGVPNVWTRSVARTTWKLTDQLEAEAERMFEQISEQGGVVRGSRTAGSRSASPRARRVSSGRSSSAAARRGRE
jgi:hypothetical protein